MSPYSGSKSDGVMGMVSAAHTEHEVGDDVMLLGCMGGHRHNGWKMELCMQRLANGMRHG